MIKISEEDTILESLENANTVPIGEGVEGESPETIVRELFKVENLPFITELDGTQINEIVKLKNIARRFSATDFPTLAKLYPIEATIDNLINDFQLGMVSLKRKRVQEFLDGILGERENKQNKPDFIGGFKDKFMKQ